MSLASGAVPSQVTARGPGFIARFTTQVKRKVSLALDGRDRRSRLPDLPIVCGRGTLSAVRQASPPGVLTGESERETMDRGPASVEVPVLQPGDVCLRDARTLRELRLSPTELHAASTNRVAGLVELGDCGKGAHGRNVCASAHTAKPCGPLAPFGSSAATTSLRRSGRREASSSPLAACGP